MSEPVRKPRTADIALFIALGAVLLLALALRLYRLDAQSFWYDEGNSARIAERSSQLIIEGAAGDIHPPLYYLLLSAWRSFAGESEAALRGLSVLCGVLLTLFTYLLGRDMLNRRVGLVAAALMAVSPFAVYYSQEARMYVMLALFAAASTWALVRMEIGDRGLEIAGRRDVAMAALYVGATAAGLYTQYAYPFVMLAQGVCVLLALGAHRERWQQRLLAYAVLNGIAIFLFLPWLPIAISQVTSWTVAPAAYDLGQAALDTARWLVVGRTLPLEQAALPLIAMGALIGVALLPPTRGMRWMLVVLLVLPFALLFVFGLYREAYLKFLLVCVAPMLILAAAGITRAAERIASAGIFTAPPVRSHVVASSMAGLLTLGLAITLYPALDNLYHNPAYARDDYRGIARRIEADAQPGDAVLLNAPNQWEVFTYYHRSGAPAIPLKYRPANENAVAQHMADISAQHARLFVLFYGERESDPNALYERWLTQNAYKADEQWVGNIRLALYGTSAPVESQRHAAAFGGVITLISAAISAPQANPGDLIQLRLTFRADRTIEQRYKVFVHLGAADAPPVAQNDSEPVAGFRPTTTWNAGEDIVDQRAVWVKPDTPAGVYGLYLGIYDSASGQRLLLRDGSDRLWLGEVTVGKP